MPFTFRIVFTGLWAFVPEEPFKEGPGNCTVLAPDLRMPMALLHHSNRNVSIGQHAPIISFHPIDLDDDSQEKPHLFFRLKKSDPDCVAHFLSMRDISVHVDGVELPEGELEVEYAPRGFQREPSGPGDARSLSWLLPMCDAGADRADGKFDEDGPLHPGITMRIRLGDGLLYTNRIARDESNEYTFWMFDLSTASKASVVAQEVAWEIQAFEQVELRLDDGINEPTGLVFAPNATAPTADVVVKLVNVEMDRILGLLSELFDGGPPSDDVDDDVLSYFGLASSPNLPLQSLCRFYPLGSHHSGASKPCAPSGFNGFS